MDEQITVSKVGQPAITNQYSRKLFYDEQFSETSIENLAVHVVDVLVFTLQGEVILQKRSFDKRHNPSLIDKSVGGHITFGDSADYTVMVETVQELLTPSFVLKDEKDFLKTLKLLKPYLSTIALMKLEDLKEFEFAKTVDGKEFPVNNVVHLYFGIYEGRMRPADKEASGVLYYNLASLRSEIEQKPDLFTDDLKNMLKHYKTEIDHFVDLIRHKI